MARGDTSQVASPRVTTSPSPGIGPAQQGVRHACVYPGVARRFPLVAARRGWVSGPSSLVYRVDDPTLSRGRIRDGVQPGLGGGRTNRGPRGPALPESPPAL